MQNSTPIVKEWTHFRFTRESPHIPESIWIVPSSPQELHIQGSQKALELLQKLPNYGLAVVGTRNPQARSLAFVQKMISELSGSDLIIVSGLARGIDAAAHSAALDAGLPTIAILGAGLDLDYPRENRDLRARILNSGGLVISEFPFGMPAQGHQFLQRNRLIAGWSKATWVVEAGIPSGALSTARWAQEQNRTCFATPSFPNDPAFAGNESLLDRDHALAFWGSHSLGAVWLELATLTSSKNSKKKIPNRVTQRDPKTQLELAFSDDEILTRHVKNLTHQQSGVQIQELLNWALP